jgi:sugar lactone lactonase YvrE
VKLAALLVVALTIGVTPRPAGLEVGETWTPTIVVKPASSRVSLVISKRATTRSFRARPLGRGRYRAQVVFPSTGRWTYAVRAGSRTVRAGATTIVPVRIRQAGDVAVDADGSIVVADAAGRVLRARGGTLTVAARPAFAVEVAPDPRGGVGVVHAERFVRNVAPDGSLRLVADLNGPTSLAYAPDGTLYVAEIGGRIVRVGVDGAAAPLSDGLNRPHGLAVVGDTLYIGDTFDNELLALDLRTRALRVVSTQLNTPVDVAAAPDGSVVVADYGNRRVARVTPDGTTTTLVELPEVNSVWVAPDGAVYVTERGASRVRRVDPATRAITTVVGR